jgi:hypothetical protein
MIFKQPRIEPGAAQVSRVCLYLLSADRIVYGACLAGWEARRAG